MNKTLIKEMIKKAIDEKCSDIHIKSDEKVFFRKNGELLKSDIHIEDVLVLTYLEEILDNMEYEKLLEDGEINKTITYTDRRLRTCFFLSDGKPSLSMRLIDDSLIELNSLDIYEDVLDIIKTLEGLVLITGVSGSGKTMTLNSIVEFINLNYSYNILMIEDPMEYMHRSKKSLINQREVPTDTKTYAKGLKSALRQDPDIIVLGELRDLESISIALTAAETGHLVLATLHTMGSSKTIDRIIDVFPDSQQNQIRIQVSTALRAIFSQKLVKSGSGRKAIFDKLVINKAISNLIRENKTYQIDNIFKNRKER